MTDKKFNQLRFDICENVRLHTQQPEMKTLLELDLYPDVEIKDKGNHLKIEGFLRLKGAYQSGEETEDASSYEQDESHEELSYIIPVEITLPADRAELDHISAEIESFDYQVLSPFELQIDAILLIDGLIPEKEGEESLTEKDIPMFSGSEATLETRSQEEEPDQEGEEISNESQNESHPQKEEVVNDQPIERVKELVGDEVSSQLEEQSSEEPTDSKLNEEIQSVFETENELESHQEEQTQLEEVEETITKEESDSNEEDWSRWLLREKNENFTSLRMIIVQEGDSVQEIAERYEITPHQIRQVNKLEDRELEKGQIIYIPQKNEKNVSSSQQE